MSIDPRAPVPPLSHTPSTLLVESWLNQSLAVRISSDARLLIGYFTCLDRQGNLVLDNTYEYPAPKDEKEGGLPVQRLANQEGRSVGLVMVPRKEWNGVWLHTGQQPQEQERSNTTTSSNDAYI